MAELWGCNRPGIFMRKKPLDTRPFLLDHFIRAREHIRRNRQADLGLHPNPTGEGNDEG